MKNRYKKGADFERKLVNQARKQGKLAFRTAGSKSPIDVCIIDTKLRIIRFIQAKASKLSQNALYKLQSEFNNLSDVDYLVKFEIIEK